MVLFVGDLRGVALIRMQFKLGLIVQHPFEVLDGYPDHVFLGGGIGDLQGHAPQGHGTVINGLGSHQQRNGMVCGGYLVSLYGVIHLVASLIEPESVRKFHRNTPFLRRQTERMHRNPLRLGDRCEHTGCTAGQAGF